MISVNVERIRIVVFLNGKNNEDTEHVYFVTDRTEWHPHPKVNKQIDMNLERGVMFGTGLNYYEKNFRGVLPLDIQLTIGREDGSEDGVLMNTGEDGFEAIQKAYNNLLLNKELPAESRVFSMRVVEAHQPKEEVKN